MSTLAIFDVDHTLLKGDSLKWFSWFLLKRKGIRIHHVFGFGTSLLCRFLCLSDVEDLKIRYLKVLCDRLTVSEVKLLANEFVQHLLIGRVRQKGIEWLKWHKSKRHRIIFLSASLDIYLAILGKFLDVDTVICTQLVEDDGLLTGEIKGANCKGREKLRRLLELYREDDIDWVSSYAYSDSSSDVPVLEHVGNPVVINPCSKLAEIALQRKWKIEKWN